MKLNSILYASLLAAPVLGKGKKLTPSQVEGDIKKSLLKATMQDFYDIALENDGNRAFGLPGYEASSDYVLSFVKGKYGKYFDTSLQYFNHSFEATKDIWVRGPDGEDVYVVTLQYNDATPAGGVTAPLVAIPVDDERGSGCFADQWEGIDVTGKIALIKRGACAINEKLRIAKNKGALAAILIHNVPGDTITGATLTAESIGHIVPVGVIRNAVGVAWQERLAAGETLEVTLLVDSSNEIRETWNVIAETKEGDADNVVMIGAHLDGVQAGAGMNDNASGSSAVLEIAKSFTRYTGYKNKVRFAWWGAEESGLVGSTHYVDQLSEEEKNKLRFYFNYDMIGSPTPTFYVQATTDADKVGGNLLFDWLKKKGKKPVWEEFSDGSDFLPFIEAGIPSSAISTGAEAVNDICYHLACDNMLNIHWEALKINAKTAGRALAQLALSMDDLPRREKNAQRKRGIASAPKGAERLASTV